MAGRDEGGNLRQRLPADQLVHVLGRRELVGVEARIAVIGLASRLGSDDAERPLTAEMEVGVSANTRAAPARIMAVLADPFRLKAV